MVPPQFGIIMKPDENALPNFFQAMDKYAKWVMSGFHPVGIVSFMQSEKNFEIT